MTMRKFLCSLLLCVMMVGGFTLNVSAYNGYDVIIEDDADLLTSVEENRLYEVMEPITAYGNVAFVTIYENDRSTESFCRNYYREQFGTASGTLFVIDMDNRYIWIHSDGAIYKVITKSYADTITDNSYSYASDEEYYACAEKAFSQILARLEGHKIAQPMKYISNALLAVILGLLLNFGVVKLMSRTSKPGEKELLIGTRYCYRLDNPQVTYKNTTKKYSPQSSGSSGGGRSGGGGGGRSGGGGGHRF